jgi:16S rRNA (cytosine967-C5)-methyltransferase
MEANTRKSVYDLLLRMEKGAYSPIILNTELQKHKSGKSFITALFYGVIERRLTLDHIIKLFAASEPDISARILLRMAIYQIMFMDSVPEHSAVNESVELAQKRSKGYINGILRNFLRSDGDFIKEADLSVKYSCPQWLIDKWQREYGEEATLQILRTSLGKPPEFVRGELPCRDGTTAQPLRQDDSSYKACELLDPQPSDVILDVCAAPGGKSFTLAKLMNKENNAENITGRIISCDINRKKLNYVEKTAGKLGLFIIETCVNDAKVFNPDFPIADKVLCDVPCSGLGVIRRKPEIKYKNPADFDGLPAVQAEILATSSRYVKDSGMLMYSTCTLSRAENDDVVAEFLEKHPKFELAGKRTTIPEENGGDGFFTALMRKT